MNQGRGLKRLAWFFRGELLRSEPSQLVVDERQKLLDCRRVALFNPRDNLSHVGHLEQHTARLMAV